MDFAVKALKTLPALAVIGDYCVFDLRLWESDYMSPFAIDRKP